MRALQKQTLFLHAAVFRDFLNYDISKTSSVFKYVFIEGYIKLFESIY